MFRNYLKISLRNLVRHRAYSIINIAGLSIGLSCFLLISLYVLDELSYDRFFSKSGQIHRVNSDIRFGGSEMYIPTTSDMMGYTMKKDYPDVIDYARIYNSGGNKMLRKGNEYFNETRLAHADSSFFQIFDLPLLEGRAETALNKPYTVAISESAAQKYFGTVSCVGKTLQTNQTDEQPYEVTAVYKDIPSNAHFQFDFLFSMHSVDYAWGSYLSHNFHTYLLLKEGARVERFKDYFRQYTEQYVLPQAKQTMQIESMDDFRKMGNNLEYSLTPLTEIHLYSTRSFEIGNTGTIQYVYIFSAVAIFILLIACINFMNLTTAKSANRAREVGIRKVLGTERKNLVVQFLSESILMATLALVLAILAAYLLLPSFNNLANKNLSLGSLLTIRLIPALIALPFIVGAIAGSYPAIYLSGFRPIEVLKGRLKARSGGIGLRSTLVVFQFATSIVLITATFVIYSQLNYIQSKNLGYKRDQVLIINDADALQNNNNAFRQEMLQVPGVRSATSSGYLPVSSSRSDESFFKSPVFDAKEGFNMQHWLVDHDYLETLGMEMTQGRFFSRDFGSDSSAIVINEAAAKLLGYEDPVGKKLYGLRNMESQEVITYNIIGVVKNFHYESMRQEIGPLSLKLGNSKWMAAFKIDAANASPIIKAAEAKWKTLAPGMPFNYAFMDESFNQLYRTEQRVATIAIIFSLLAIFIACLGLFALATFVAEQRTKEIGIRKVLGATVQGIVGMLASNFARLVLVSIVIATPVAYFLMHKWLEDFAFRIDLEWYVFAGAGLIVLLIAMMTVSVQAIRAAIANPVNSLHNE